MKCANCARDNPTGARYCVHCGAEQAMPTPIAAVAAAAMAARVRRAIPQAANAAHAEPVPDHAALAAQSNGSSKGVDSPGEAPRNSGLVEQPAKAGRRVAQVAPPAYASAPKRMGLAFSIVVACLVTAAATFFAWRMVAPDPFVRAGDQGDERSSVMSALPPVVGSAKQNRVPDGDRQADTTSLAAGETPAAPPVTSTDKRSAEPPLQEGKAGPLPDRNVVAQSASAVSPQPVEITPLPAKPALRTPKKSASERETQKQVTVPAAPVTPAPSAPAAPAPPMTVAGASPRTTAAADPWARMREELATCTREDFITRVICSQRVRFRYCANYWGKVPECPGNPAPDHGQ